MTRSAVVQVPAFMEPALGRALDGVAGQRDVDGWTIDREAWVTIGHGDNETWRIARDHAAFTPREAPPGKLSARNAAHDTAFAEGADVAVTWDADVYPAHDGVLEALLAPFDRRAVVATNGNPRAPATSPLGLLTRFTSLAQDVLQPHLHGQLAALSADAWAAAGPFRTDDVDQTNSHDVRAEEEFAFLRRLREAGDVAFVPSAKVYEPPRRTLRTLNRAAHSMTGGRYGLDEYERTRGAETFDRH